MRVANWLDKKGREQAVKEDYTRLIQLDPVTQFLSLFQQDKASLGLS